MNWKKQQSKLKQIVEEEKICNYPLKKKNRIFFDVDEVYLKNEEVYQNKQRENLAKSILKYQLNERKYKNKSISVKSVGMLPEEFDYESCSGDSEQDQNNDVVQRMISMKKQLSYQQSIFNQQKSIRKYGQKGNVIWRQFIAQQLKTIVDIKKKKSGLDKFVFSQNNIKYLIWKYFVMIVSLLSSFYYFYYAAFIPQMNDPQILHFTIIDAIYQVIYIIDLFIQPFISIEDINTGEHEKSFKILAVQYLKGGFIIDILTIIPFYTIFNNFLNFARLLLLIKVVRIYRGVEVLNTFQFKNQIQTIIMMRIKRLIATDKQKAKDRYVDRNHISNIILSYYIFKTIKLIIIMISVSIFVGLFWYIFCEIRLTLNTLMLVDEEEQLNFIVYNGLEDNNFEINFIIFTYFSVSTLTTVGFGDYYPRTNIERLIGTFILLTGLITASYILESLSTMIVQIKTISQDRLNEKNQLVKFIGTLERFNKGTLDQQFILQMEKYFDYRWSKNINNAFESEEDQYLYQKLPEYVQIKLKIDFLFVDFLKLYSDLFKFQKSNSQLQSSVKLKFDRQKTKQLGKAMTMKRGVTQLATGFLESKNKSIYTIADVEYQELLNNVLRRLEARFLPPNYIFQKQNQEVLEFYFFMKGEFNVGYNHHFFVAQQNMFEEDEFYKESALVNLIKYDISKYHFPSKFQKGEVAGIYEVNFKSLSQFLYKTGNHECDCFFIRKRAWRDIVEFLESADPNIYKQLQQKILLRYTNKIYYPIQEYQDNIQKDAYQREIYELMQWKEEIEKQQQNSEQTSQYLSDNSMADYEDQGVEQLIETKEKNNVTYFQDKKAILQKKKTLILQKKKTLVEQKIKKLQNHINFDILNNKKTAKDHGGIQALLSSEINNIYKFRLQQQMDDYVTTYNSSIIEEDEDDSLKSIESKKSRRKSIGIANTGPLMPQVQSQVSQKTKSQQIIFKNDPTLQNIQESMSIKSDTGSSEKNIKKYFAENQQSQQPPKLSKQKTQNLKNNQKPMVLQTQNSKKSSEQQNEKNHLQSHSITSSGESIIKSGSHSSFESISIQEISSKKDYSSIKSTESQGVTLFEKSIKNLDLLELIEKLFHKDKKQSRNFESQQKFLLDEIRSSSTFSHKHKNSCSCSDDDMDNEENIQEIIIEQIEKYEETILTILNKYQSLNDQFKIEQEKCKSLESKNTELQAEINDLKQQSNKTLNNNNNIQKTELQQFNLQILQIFPTAKQKTLIVNNQSSQTDKVITQNQIQMPKQETLSSYRSEQQEQYDQIQNHTQSNNESEQLQEIQSQEGDKTINNDNNQPIQINRILTISHSSDIQQFYNENQIQRQNSNQVAVQLNNQLTVESDKKQSISSNQEDQSHSSTNQQEQELEQIQVQELVHSQDNIEQRQIPIINQRNNQIDQQPVFRTAERYVEENKELNENSQSRSSFEIRPERQREMSQSIQQSESNINEPMNSLSILEQN